MSKIAISKLVKKQKDPYKLSINETKAVIGSWGSPDLCQSLEKKYEGVSVTVNGMPDSFGRATYTISPSSITLKDFQQAASICPNLRSKFLDAPTMASSILSGHTNLFTHPS